jgi:hypothetical protein
MLRSFAVLQKAQDDKLLLAENLGNGRHAALECK